MVLTFDRFGYCAYNQMGEFNENSDGKKECVFYLFISRTRLFRRSPNCMEIN